MDKKPFHVDGATLPFFSYEKEGILYYTFDSSECEPPEPMVNALRGLALLDAPDKRLLMVNMQQPTALYSRIADEFGWDARINETGELEILFWRKFPRNRE